jgi:lysozyme family protein
MRDFPQQKAEEIYKASYWDNCKADSLPEVIRFDVFDGAVNSGVAQSVRWLQQSIGAEADGVVGPQTIRMSQDHQNLVAKYNGHRLMFMTQLKVWPVFSGGWAKRIAHNLIGD